MKKSYLNSERNNALILKSSRTFHLLLMVLFVFITSNVSNAQNASTTWSLTANGNPTNVGNVSGTTIAFGSGLNSPAYSTGAGVTTGSWSSDAGSLRNDEYYEFEVTPNVNTVFNVTAINFEHSRSSGDWQVRAYYSTDDFVTSTAVANAFSSNSSTPVINNNTVNIGVENTTLKVRIYGWESDGSNRSLRIRNVVISGTTCTKPSVAGTITGTTAVCQGANSITYSVPAITNATGYTWTLPAGATIASGANTRTITVNYSLSAISGNITVQGTNSCGSGTVSPAFAVTVNTAPTVTITGASGVCIGSSTTLIAATGGGTWSSSNTSRATVDSNGIVTGIAAGSVTIAYSVTVNGCTGTDTHVINVSSSPTPLITFTQNSHDISQSITACGQVGGGGQNDLDIFSGNPGGSSTYQWQISSDNGVTWVNASGPTSTQTQYTLDPFYTTFTSNAGVYKFRLIINNNGCSGISDSISLTVTGTSALTAGTIVGNQSSCGSSLDPASFTSSAPAGGLGTGTYTYQWQSSTDGVNFINIAGATSTTYNSAAITQTTYFRRSVKSGGCSAVSNVLSVLVGAPIANVSLQTSCASSTGTVTVPFPISGITYTITGTNPVTSPVTNSSGIFSGLAPGIYNVVFNAAACISLPTPVTINAQPPIPTMPVMTIAQPCGVATGTITVTAQNAGDTYSFDNGSTFQASNVKSGLAPGNYYVIIKNSVGCKSPSKLTVINANPTIPSTPAITSVLDPNCAVSTGTITVTVQNGGEFYSFDNGLTFQSSNIKSGLTAGSYNVIIQSAGGCNSPSKQVTINAQPTVPLAPTVTETAPTCALQTGTITITQVGTETYSFDDGAFSSTLIYSGLAQGSLHTIRAQNAGGCISPTVNISITSLSNTWSAGAWTLGTPTAEQNIVFDDTFSSTEDLSGCSCQVNSGINVTINSPHTLTVTNAVTVSGTGNLTFEDKSSLVQINNVNNTGEIDYLRTTDTGIYNTDYIYWSSPVEGITLGDVSRNLTKSDKYYSYVATATGEDWQQESSMTPMESGRGYIIRGSEYSPSVQPGVKYTATFTGVPNNGHYEITPIYADKSYLLGNPYPSALDADTFLADNADVLNGTLYFWTHNTDMQARGNILSSAGSGAFAYTTNDYATYNATGGVSASPPDLGAITGGAPVGANSGSNNNYSQPTGKIASGQGFFASTKATGLTATKIIFDNTMRVGVNGITGNNSQFFKTKNPNGKTANTKVIEKNRVWLNFTNTQGTFKQTLVGYITGATNEYDDRFDGESFDGNEFVDFYSVNQDKNLTIQGRALPFDENDEVPLGFRTTINGDFTINIAQADGVLTNQAVFIEDKLTNTITDLKSGNYTFNTVAGTFDDRFMLKYTNKTLSLETIDKEDGILAFYSNNYKTLIIKNNLAEATVNSVALFNMLGQKIENWDVSESEQTDVQIPIKNMSSGIYVVKIKTTKGESSKKIIVN